MKITKKERKQKIQLARQHRNVSRLEQVIMNDLEYVYCPTEHHFTNNNNGLDLYCREFFVPKGTVLTGITYKIEAFFMFAKGKMRFIVGDGWVDYDATECPILLKNVPGQKNGAYAYEDCLFFSFSPNPENSRDLHEVMSVFSQDDPSLVQGMGKNKQELMRLENVA